MPTNEESINKIKNNTSHSSMAIWLQEVDIRQTKPTESSYRLCIKRVHSEYRQLAKNKHKQLEPLQKFLSDEIVLPKPSAH